MRLETTAANLKAVMALTQGLTTAKAMVPILSTVKIGKGRVTANDLDMAVEVALPTIGKDDGEAAIDAKSLSALSRHIGKDETVVLSETDGLATIAFNGSEYRLASLPASDYPKFDRIEGARSLTGNAGIVDAMRRIRFAVSTEETRYYLNGVCFFQKPDGGVMLCATNGHVLAMIDLPSAPEKAEGKIVPRQCVSYLCARKGEPNAITFADLRAKFELDGLTLSTKLIDGTYPDVCRVIPKDVQPYFTVDRTEALVVLRRMAAFAGGGWNGVKITGSPAGLVLSMKRGEREAKETLAADVHIAGFEAGYNYAYLIDILTQLRADKVTLSAEKDMISGSPALITAEDDDLRVVITPMRV